MPYLSLNFQFCQCSPALFDIFFGIGPVNLVQINDIHLQTTQALFHLLPDRSGLQHTGNLAIRCRYAGTLGEDIWTPGPTFQGTPNNFFSMTESIYCGGINP